MLAYSHRIARRLLSSKHGFSWRQDCDQKTPLHHAIENGHSGIISLLLSAPETDLTARDRLGRAPFTLAMTMKNNKAAQAILGREPGVAEQVRWRAGLFRVVCWL